MVDLVHIVTRGRRLQHRETSICTRRWVDAICLMYSPERHNVCKKQLALFKALALLHARVCSTAAIHYGTYSKVMESLSNVELKSICGFLK